MTLGTPWSVKGIDPKAREVAKDLARRSGMTLGEWLNRMILEDDGPDDVTSESYFSERPVKTAYFDAPRELARDYEPVSPSPRFEAPAHPGDEISRVAAALDRLAHRIDESEARTGLAISGVEQSVREAVERIETAEREHVAVAARFEGAVEEVQVAQQRLAERQRRAELEASGPRSAEALKALETALGKVAGHLYDGEGRTQEILAAVEGRIARLEAHEAPEPIDPRAIIDDILGRVSDRLGEADARTQTALDGLRASFAALDGRLHKAESEAGVGIEQRFERLAASLSDRVEASRAELAQSLKGSVDGRFDRMEQALGKMAEQVGAAERGSAEAIGKIGREVSTMAETLTRRVQTSEQRSAESMLRVGGEVARIAGAVEDRLSRAELTQAEALAKLGAEIGRITERLGERMGAAERRSAQAIDDVGEQVARVAERLGQRHDRASEELSERIRLSEERTARLLEEARERIDTRLSDAQRLMENQAAEAARLNQPAAAEPAFADLAPFPMTPPEGLDPEVAAEFEAEAEPEGDDNLPSPFARQALAANPEGSEGPVAEPVAAFPEDTAPAQFEAEDIEVADGFAAVSESETLAALDDDAEFEDDAAFVDAEASELAAAVPEAPGMESSFASADGEDDDSHDPMEAFAPSPMAQEPESFAAAAPDVERRPLSTREVIEQARAAARAASMVTESRKPRLLRAASPKIQKDDKPATESGSLFSGFGFMKPKRRAGSSTATALMITGGAAFLGLAASGIVLMEASPGGSAPKRVTDGIEAARSGEEVLGGESDALSGTPRAAVALSPQPIGTVTPAPLTVPASTSAANDSVKLLYADAVRDIENHRPGGVDRLKAAANQGYAPAQYYLSKLFENGDAGLKKDLVEGRRWIERAAQGGNPQAMHSLAIAYFYGTGGAKNTTTAGEWFRRAADMGFVDSQYNLARLYEDGIGVGRNAAEAYKWYLIAGRAGDAESVTGANRMKAQLSSDARAVAERAAAGFRVAANATPKPTVQASVDSLAVVTAQRALSRLGYYQGPTDGALSPALRMAVAAYQRDQSAPATGELDDMTVSRLAVFTR